MVLRRTSKAPPQGVLDRPMARTLLESIDGDRTVAEILLHVHGSEYVVTKFLFELYQNGFLEIIGVKKIEPVQARPADDAPPHEPLQPETGTREDLPDFSDLAAPDTEAPPPAPAVGAVDTETLVSMPDLSPEPVAPQTDHAAAAPEAQPVAVASATETHGGVEITAGVELADKSDAYQLAHRLERARIMTRGGEFENALEILDTLYKEYPGDESLRRLVAEAEAAFIEKAYRHFLPPNKIPRLTRPVESLATEGISPTEFFLLSRVDGTWDVKSIVQIAPLRETETLRTLKRMREAGVIELIDAKDS
jgi:hypothetical protein